MHPVATLALQAPKPAATISDNLVLPPTLADLERWFSTAEAGSTLVYHRGYLALDRGPGSRLGEDAGEELDRVAAALMAMAEPGHVHLMQRRHGAYDYTYLAVAIRAGASRRGHGHRTRETAP